MELELVTGQITIITVQ